jgi:hypothetical protein
MICKIVQYHLSNLDEAEPRGFASRHLERCQSCEKYRAKLSRLDQELRSAVRLAPRPSSASEASLGSRGGLPALAALTCAIAVMVLVWKGAETQKPARAPAPTQVASVHHLPSEPQIQAHAPSPRWDLAPIRSLRTRAPMREELAALRQDGKRGLDALLAIGRQN